MNKERYNQIIDEAYNNYVKTSKPTLDGKYISQPEFIFWVKTNDNFSKKWGLKIEERELSDDERFRIAYKDLELRKKLESESKMLHFPDGHNKVMDESNIPTKLITVTYNNETMEIYE